MERKSALCYGVINIQGFFQTGAALPPIDPTPPPLPPCGSICVSCINHPGGHEFAQLERVAVGVRASESCLLVA